MVQSAYLDLSGRQGRQGQRDQLGSFGIAAGHAATRKLTAEDAVAKLGWPSGDGRFYGGLGIEAVAFGVGGQGQHGAGEYAEISTIGPYYRALRQFLHSDQNPSSRV